METDKIELMIAETLYYYLVSDICNAFEDDDKEALDDAIRNIMNVFPNRDEYITMLLNDVLSSVSDTEDDIENTIFIAIERLIY
jgi:hypothetical protein